MVGYVPRLRLTVLQYPLIITFIFSIMVVLGGCNSSSGNDNGMPSDDASEKDDVSAEGIWRGTFTEAESQTYGVNAVLYDGDLFAVSPSARMMYVGDYQVADGDISGDLVNIEIAGFDQGTSKLDGTVDPEDKISGTTVNTYYDGASTTSEVSLIYDDLFDRGARLSRLEGTWLFESIMLQVDDSGGFTGDDSAGCFLEGTFSVPDSAKNIYEMSITITGSNCNFVGTYTGYAFTSDRQVEGDNEVLSVMFTGDQMAFFYDFLTN